MDFASGKRILTGIVGMLGNGRAAGRRPEVRFA